MENKGSIFVLSSERTIYKVICKDSLENLKCVLGPKLVILDGSLEGVADVVNEMNKLEDVDVIVV